MFTYSMEDVRRVASRTTDVVAREEATAKQAMKVLVKEDNDVGQWGQHSMTEIIAFQECNNFCQHVAGWLHA